MSRLPSSRGSSTATATRGAGARGAAAQRRPGVFVQAPKSDIYVALLGISLAAILIATLMMILLFSQYSFSTKISAAQPPPAATRIASVDFSDHCTLVNS